MDDIFSKVALQSEWVRVSETGSPMARRGGGTCPRDTDPLRSLITGCQVSSGCFAAEETGNVVPTEIDGLACFYGAMKSRSLTSV